MSTAELDLFTTLPSAVSCAILSEWVARGDVGRLDSAYCRNNERAVVLAMLQSPEFTMQQSSCKGLAWLILRKIKVRSVIFGMTINYELAAKYLSAFGRYIHSFTLEWSDKEDILKLAVEHCGNLTSLTTFACVFSPVILELLRNNPNLSDVNIDCKQSTLPVGCDVSDIILPKMCTLKVDYDKPMEQESLHALFHMFQSVSKMEVCGVPGPSLAQLLPTHLRTLSLFGAAIDTEGLAAMVQQCPHVIHLDMRLDRDIADVDILTVVGSSLKLRSLAFIVNDQLTDRSVKYIKKYCAETLRVLYMLHYLSTPGQWAFSASAVQSLQQRCPLLRVDWDVKVGTDTLSEGNDITLALCTSLSFDVITVTDKLLNDVATYCSKIHTLDITYEYISGPEYSVDRVRAIVSKCTNLRTIFANTWTLKKELSSLVAEYPFLFKGGFEGFMHEAFSFPIE